MRTLGLGTILVLAVASPPGTAGLGGSDRHPEVVLSHPEAPWSLVLRLPPSFEAGPARRSHGGSTVTATAADPESGLLLRARIDPGGPARDSRQCRERAWKRRDTSARGTRGVRRHDRGDRAVLEYTVIERSGVKLSRRHLGVWIHRDGLCAAVEATLAPYDEQAHRPLLDEVPGWIEIRPR